MQSTCAILYCHLWPVWLYHIFPHYLITGKNFGKKLLKMKCVFWFSLRLLPETFLILRSIQRDIIINAHESSCKVWPLLPIRCRCRVLLLHLITLRHTTLGRTPLDEWPARRRDLYLTTHNTDKRQTSMPSAGFEPAIPAGERPQAHALDGAATRIDT
jgi:hypothetical protein